MNSVSDQQMTNKMLLQKLLKKQNRIQTQFQKKIQIDTDDYEYFMSQLFVTKTTETEIIYDMFIT